MRWLVVLILTCCFGFAAAQPYTDQDRLGKTSAQVVELGHDAFVKWFCDPSRAGVTGRVQAERIFGYELGVQNNLLQQYRPPSERKFHEETSLLFANTCKSAFTIEHARNGDWEGSSLLVAEACTLVNLSLRELMSKATVTMEFDFKSIYATLEKHKNLGTRAVYNANPTYVQREYAGLTLLVKKIEERFKSRSRGEQEVAFRFAQAMVRDATTLQPQS